MSIKRAPRPESNFYLLDKRIADDKRLSWAARGLLIFLLGKPDHWQVSVEHLRKETSDSAKPTGRDGVYSILSELIEAGYVTRVQSRTDAGRMAEAEYIVSEIPTKKQDCSDHQQQDQPETVQPLTEKPDTGKPDTANPTQVSIDLQQGLKSVSTEKPLVTAERRPAKSDRGSRIPDDWKPDMQWTREFRPDMTDADIQRMADSFRDYWISAPSSKGRKADWKATWRNWVRNDLGRASPRQPQKKSRHVGLNDIDHTVGLIDNGDGTYDF